MTCPSTGRKQLKPACNCCVAAEKGCIIYLSNGNVTACPKKWSQSLSCMLRQDLSWCWIKSPCCLTMHVCVLMILKIHMGWGFSDNGWNAAPACNLSFHWNTRPCSHALCGSVHKQFKKTGNGTVKPNTEIAQLIHLVSQFQLFKPVDDYP
jgi:hypothetical protein